MGTHGYGNPTGTTTDIEVVQAIYERFSARAWEEALAHFHEDVELVVPGTAAAIGRTEPYRGHDGIRQYFADVERVWEELAIHAEDIRVASGSIVVFGRVEGRMDGVAVRRRVVWTWRLRDGRAASVRANDLGDA